MPTKKRSAQYQKSQYSIPAGSLVDRNKAAISQKAVRKVGLKALKAGTHPQQYRNYNAPGQRAVAGPLAKLGPMGELGDDIIMEVALTSAADQAMRQKTYGREFTKTALQREFWQQVLNPLREQVEHKIDLWVPVDSGDLAESMKNALYPAGGSSDRGFPFKILLNTKDIPYAKVVNQMPAKYLKHPAPYHRNTSSRTGNRLSDGSAVKGFYNIVLLFARNKAKELMKNYITYLKSFVTFAVGTSQAHIVAKQLITARYI